MFFLDAILAEEDEGDDNDKSSGNTSYQNTQSDEWWYCIVGTPIVALQ